MRKKLLQMLIAAMFVYFASITGCEHGDSVLLPGGDGIYSSAELTITNWKTHDTLAVEQFNIMEKDRKDFSGFNRFDLNTAESSFLGYRVLGDIPDVELYWIYMTIYREKISMVETYAFPYTGSIGSELVNLGGIYGWIYTVNGQKTDNIQIEFTGQNYLRETTFVDTYTINLSKNNLIIPMNEPTHIPGYIDTLNSGDLRYDLILPDELTINKEYGKVLAKPIMFLMFWEVPETGEILSIPTISFRHEFRIRTLNLPFESLYLFPVSGIIK